MSTLLLAIGILLGDVILLLKNDGKPEGVIPTRATGRHPPPRHRRADRSEIRRSKKASRPARGRRVPAGTSHRRRQQAWEGKFQLVPPSSSRKAR
jgi:hypothetical protein